MAQFRRIAVINRGESAMRLIRAVKELNSAEDAGLCSIAIYTDPDARALFVREADEAWCLGSAGPAASDQIVAGHKTVGVARKTGAERPSDIGATSCKLQGALQIAMRKGLLKP